MILYMSVYTGKKREKDKTYVSTSYSYQFNLFLIARKKLVSLYFKLASYEVYSCKRCVFECLLRYKSVANTREKKNHIERHRTRPK